MWMCHQLVWITFYSRRSTTKENKKKKKNQAQSDLIHLCDYNLLCAHKHLTQVTTFIVCVWLDYLKSPQGINRFREIPCWTETPWVTSSSLRTPDSNHMVQSTGQTLWLSFLEFAHFLPSTVPKNPYQYVDCYKEPTMTQLRCPWILRKCFPRNSHCTICITLKICK